MLDAEGSVTHTQVEADSFELFEQMKQKPRCLCNQEQVSALHSHRIYIYSQLHADANL